MVVAPARAAPVPLCNDPPRAPAGGELPPHRSPHRSALAPFIRLAIVSVVCFGCLGFSGTASAQEPPSGAIRGTVTDADFHGPVPRVRVTIVEALIATVTTAEGTFFLERVPPGIYTLSFAREGYERRVVPNVSVSAGRLTELRVDLSTEVIDLDELVVTGEDLLADSELGALEIRAAAASIQDAISSEIISKAGASDAAGALKLVVGASVSEGKYATVRGLSDRYTGTTLNGVRVPSADPRRRAVQIDVFPTGTIENITVTKTFTPDLQGDFTGGGVDIRTRSIPEGRVLGASIGIETNNQATGEDGFLTYSGGGVDPFGYAGSDRAIPEGAEDFSTPLPEFSENPTKEQTQASQDYDRLTRSFEPTMGVGEEAPGLNYSLAGVFGDRVELGGEGLFGYLGAFTYNHKYDLYENAENNSGAVGAPGAPLSQAHLRTDTRGLDELLLGALASFDWKPTPDQGLALKLIANQSAEDEARFQVEDTGDQSVEQNQTLHYTERTVASAQLGGTHTFRNLLGSEQKGFTDFLLDWVVAGNVTRQDEPDVRFFRNTFDIATLSAEAPRNSTDAQNTRRIFREVREKDGQAILNATFSFRQWTETPGFVKVGVFYDRSDRDYDQKSFTYRFANQYGSIFDPKVQENYGWARFQATSPDQLWTDVFLDPNRIGIASNSPPAPNQLLWVIYPSGDDVDYTGDQKVQAAYAMTELPLTPRFKFIGGVRLEETDLEVIPINEAFGTVLIINVLPSGDREIARVPQEQAQASIEDAAWLPSAGVVLEMEPGMNLRASWSRTLARPSFRELAPVATEEFIFGDEYLGNQDLILSNIANYDLRWEWFRNPGQVYAMTVFFKRLQDPIELISFNAGGRTFIQPVNYPNGEVFGFEVEARTPLGFLSPALQGLSIGANLASISSRVTIPESEQEALAPYGLASTSRQLQGQPANLLNLNLTYDNERSGTSGGIFYNRTGTTLATGAARGDGDGIPSVYELPYEIVDLTVSQRIGKTTTLTFKAKNLTRPDRRSVFRTPDGQEANKTERPTGALFGLTASFKW